MPFQQFELTYPTLYQFLNGQFHQDAFFEHEYAVTMNDLIDQIYESFLVNENEAEPLYVKTLRLEMEAFLHDSTFDSFKIRFLENSIHTEMGSLEPMEFLKYLYYRLKLEINERKLLLEEREVCQ